MSSTTKYLPVIALLSPDDSSLDYIKAEIDEINKQLTNNQRIVRQTQIISEKDVTLNNFSTYLNNYGEQLVFLHFSGHANTQTLVFTEANVRSEGIAGFLSHQPNLIFVFLNGCSTYEQVQQLLQNGVPAVIATSSPVGDRISKDFAIKFYESLIAGEDSLEKAFNLACSFIKSQQDKSIEIIEVRSIGFENDSNYSDGQWALYINPNQPWIRNWKIKDAYNNPFIGLPRISDTIGYPADGKPFRGLKWYRKEDSRIFFGRSENIVDLYENLTHPDHPRLHLVHGQSGVGKSSLLFAGLLPRMIDEWEVHYFRQNYLSKIANIKITQNKTLVILDQLEEVILEGDDVFTHFLTTIQTRFLQLDPTYQIRIMFAFRKEYFAEFRDKLNAMKIEFDDDFIKLITEKQVVTIVETLANYNQIRDKYRLELKAEDELPQRIAKLLTTDEKASVAPTLQLLLTTIWDKAIPAENGWRTFDLALLEKVQKNGVFLHEKLHHWFEEWENDETPTIQQFAKNGLLLDLLYELVSIHTAAEEKEWSAFVEDYLKDPQLRTAQQLQLALDTLNNSYLIFKTFKEAKQTIVYRLAHDKLAPIIINRFNVSGAPGQQARRILEYKTKVSTTENPAYLSSSDLKVVEEGRAGMRNWTTPEEELVAASKLEIKQLNKGRRMMRTALSILGVAFVIAVGIFGYYRYMVGQEKLAQALENEGDRLEDNPTEQLKVYYKSLQITPDNLVRKEKFHATFRSNLFSKVIYENDQIVSAAISPQGTHFAILEKSGEAFRGKIFKLDSIEITQIATLENTPSANMNAFFFTDDGQQIIGGGNDHKIHRWSLDGQSMSVYLEQLNVNKLAANRTGELAVASFINKDYLLKVNIERNVVLDTLRVGKVSAVGFMPNGKELVYVDNRDACLYWEDSENLFRTSCFRDTMLPISNSTVNDWRSNRQIIQTDYQQNRVLVNSGTGVFTFNKDSATDIFFAEIPFSKRAFDVNRFSIQSTDVFYTNPFNDAFVVARGDQYALKELKNGNQTILLGNYNEKQQRIYTLNNESQLELWSLPHQQFTEYVLSEDSRFQPEVISSCKSTETQDVNLISGDYYGNIISYQKPDQIKSIYKNSNQAAVTAIEGRDQIIGFGDELGMMSFLSLKTNKIINQNDQIHTERIQKITASYDGKYFASLGAGKKIVIWDIAGGLIDTINLHNNISQFAFSTKGDQMVGIDNTGEIIIWKTGTEFSEVKRLKIDLATQPNPSPLLIGYVHNDQELVLLNDGQVIRIDLNGNIITTTSFSGIIAATANYSNAVADFRFAFLTDNLQVLFVDAAGDIPYGLDTKYNSGDLILHGNDVFLSVGNRYFNHCKIAPTSPEVFIKKFYPDW